MSRHSHIFFRGIILIGFALLIFKLMVSGDIYRFIAPKMLPYFYFALAVLVVLGTIQFLRTDSNEEADCSCDHNHSYSKSFFRSMLIYLLFIIPVMSGFLFSNHILGSSVAEKKGFKYEMRSAATKEDIIEKEELVDKQGNLEQNSSEVDTVINDSSDFEDISNQENITNSPVNEDSSANGPDVSSFLTPSEMYPEIVEQLDSAESITLTDENYIAVISVLEENITPHLGKEIEMVGFIFREEGFPENQIVVGRFGISCCTADAGIFGLLVKGKDFSTYKNDQWIRVTGKISQIDYKGWTLPLIELQQITNIDIPKQPYVYENFEY